ncbi:Protein of unknown function [Streptomyces wuyuanensis]|uniref:DUF4236 domain-containing protein n=1 Tax=Streptomyces wuyuanensis TaxID=1196353 RepID=A0A1H0A4J5_9ACTN|nr:Protein of unknown function [Streptomyces wuyuanensis]
MRAVGRSDSGIERRATDGNAPRKAGNSGKTDDQREERIVPVTFRKSFRIFPGVRLNINRKSVSITLAKGDGARRTYSSTGRRTTSMDLPGPFGYRKTTTRRSRH